MTLIRPATEADIPQAMRIVGAAKQFMRASGNLTQWAGPYPGPEHLQADIVRGNLYVVEHDGTPCAIFAFIVGEDPTYAYIEGEWPDNLPYGTLHRVATDGTQSRMLDAIVRWCLQRVDRLRMDTHRDNVPMQKAAERCGFRHCGVIYLADGNPREAFWLGKEN